MVAIVDFGMGNLFSVKQACEYIGLAAIITSEKEDLLNADAVILPGVGEFGSAMATLNKLDLIQPIFDFIKTGKPFMGICLGMQLLFTESEEFGEHKGLNIIPGSVVKFCTKNNKGERKKVPQVGWNRIMSPSWALGSFWDNTPLSNVENGEFMYFIHSYYPIPINKTAVLSVTNYLGTEYCSSILYNNVFACQFHPEKSGIKGLKIYDRFALMVKNLYKGNKNE